MRIASRDAIRRALAEKESILRFAKGRQYIQVLLTWEGNIFWLMADDGGKGQYVKTLTPEEAERVEPGILARCRAERLAKFPAADVTDRLRPLIKKKHMAEAGKISMTAEEKEALEKEIRQLNVEYEDLTCPGWREEKQRRIQAAISGYGDKP